MLGEKSVYLLSIISKAMKKKIILAVFGILIMTTTYFNSKFYLEDKTWKYSNGFHVHDFIGYEDFSDENYHICFWEYLWIINSNFEIGNYAKKEIF